MLEKALMYMKITKIFKSVHSRSLIKALLTLSDGALFSAYAPRLFFPAAHYDM